MKLILKRVFASKNSVDCFSCNELKLEGDKCMCDTRKSLGTLGKWRQIVLIRKVHYPCPKFKTIQQWKKL